MNSPNLENEIKDFYQHAELPSDTVESILDSGYYASMANRWQRVAIASMVGLAAMTLLCLSLFLSKSQTTNEVVNTFPKENIEVTQAVLDNDKKVVEKQDENPSKEVADPNQIYRLIAVRSHDHSCPHCRETKKVYDELEQEMKEAPLQFADLQMNKPTAKDAVSQLKIKPLVEGRSETAFLALTTLDGTKIREFKPSMGMKRIQKSIQSIITQ